ncbi:MULTISPECIES: sugar phosphate nucleotidyltransferase [unclassified Mesorhizobium]|uniref:sugar phosphate nucleotidyltransferase n=1 Tax=unclassified Mesorhizobium TaxID=325217 RepID=UPI000BB0785E|nr:MULTISPECIES: sugar phosphate nucleotidyltransferase [unclassified Mesorhizobium]TGT60212.1 nucleotidyltransferase family protein [Mesorhizobium sp. M00.F.Ca.ET.170.01.1.1]AZO08377.1 nucleotidyltransferase family protein [Mesorhizobium sp. M3A.F.Ca.ET.080.04.2.1]PBB84665.1 nucleotidyltransferase [Mesorhizobium sp. WSM3876]RWB72204.1 MAG: nucleotidyltransferase family protein [Mesorhizobium sp.]RWB89394.1 MAG: nucleotidyltransferase family protein [Mesorhizobium sp.]
MLGIVPAAGRGSRIQPLGFSKELLPVGSRMDGQTERPCAVSEYLVRRMVRNGVDRICFIIGSGKSDILEYYAAGYDGAAAIFVAQPSPVGLCDAIFRAAPLVAPDETVLIGLPDTIWFPEDGFCHLADDRLSFLMFPVDRPELFDAVVVDDDSRVEQIQVKQRDAATDWVWGAFKMPGGIFHELAALWREREGRDEYFGTLVNAYLAAGGEAWGVKAGTAYVDVGTFNGYRTALRLLENNEAAEVEGTPAIMPQGRSRVPSFPGEGG